MTEAEWNSCLDPAAMLEWLRTSGRASDRKLRLFAAGCSRRVWNLIDSVGRAAVEVAERYADGLATPEELRAARLACRFAGSKAAWYAAASVPAVAARNAAFSAQQGAGTTHGDQLSQEESQAQADLLRDIFGNPFRPLPAFDLTWLAWRDGLVVKLAATIYEAHRFEDAPQLGDALADAGCKNAELVAHLRGAGPHVRGCFVVDALLARR